MKTTIITKIAKAIETGEKAKAKGELTCSNKYAEAVNIAITGDAPAKGTKSYKETRGLLIAKLHKADVLKDENSCGAAASMILSVARLAIDAKHDNIASYADELECAATPFAIKKALSRRKKTAEVTELAESAAKGIDVAPSTNGTTKRQQGGKDSVVTVSKQDVKLMRAIFKGDAQAWRAAFMTVMDENPEAAHSIVDMLSSDLAEVEGLTAKAA